MRRLAAAALAIGLASSPAQAWLAAGPVGYGHWLQQYVAGISAGTAATLYITPGDGL